MEENIRGAIVCVIGMGAFIVTDAFCKYAVAVLGLPILQVLSIRGAGMVFCLSLITGRSGSEILCLSHRDGCLLLVRSILEVLGSYLFNVGLVHLPMSLATAIVQARAAPPHRRTARKPRPARPRRPFGSRAAARCCR